MQCHTLPFSVKRQMFNRNQTRMERCKNEDSVAMTLHCRREEGGSGQRGGQLGDLCYFFWISVLIIYIFPNPDNREI